MLACRPLSACGAGSVSWIGRSLSSQSERLSSSPCDSEDWGPFCTECGDGATAACASGSGERLVSWIGVLSLKKYGTAACLGHGGGVIFLDWTPVVVGGGGGGGGAVAISVLQISLQCCACCSGSEQK